MSKTPQQLGYEWDHELGRLVQGTSHIGSGNRVYQKLDASGHTLILSGKYVDSASFSIKETDLDEMLRATVGPEGHMGGLVPILAAKFKSGRVIGTLDLLQLLAWLKQPPELIPATKQDAIRHTARTPPHLRGG